MPNRHRRAGGLDTPREIRRQLVPRPGVDPETYFGYRNVSGQQIDVDMLTAVFEHDFNDQLSVRTLGRVQRVDQLSNVTALQGNWCL